MRAVVLGRYAPGNPLYLPFLLSLAECGFPSPADDYVDRVLNLDELVVKNPDATYFVRARGDSMIGAGIHDGDVLVVDRSREVEHRDIVVAVVSGELTVKRFHVKAWWGGRVARVHLLAENPDYPPIEVTPEMELTVWGVVTYVFRPVTRESRRELPEEARASRAAALARGAGISPDGIAGDGRLGEPPGLA